MKKIEEWAVGRFCYSYDVSFKEAYLEGAKKMRNEIHELIKLTEKINSDNIKERPELATTILLELADTVSSYGEENE